MTNREYEERLVCYVDILGFSDALTNPEHPCHEDAPKVIFDAINDLKDTGNPDLEDWEGPLEDLKCTQFSDCVALSCPVCDKNLRKLIRRIALVQRDLLISHFPTRGAITIGKIYHNIDPVVIKKTEAVTEYDSTGYIFGPAFVKAVKLEEKVAKYPRVIINEEVLNRAQFDKNSHFIDRDCDSVYYVEYFKTWASREVDFDLDKAHTVISMGLNRYKDTTTLEKYEWLARKYNYLAKKYNSLAKKHNLDMQKKNICSPDDVWFPLFYVEPVE